LLASIGAGDDRGARTHNLFKYVVLYALTLVLQPVLAVVLTLAAVWGLWRVLLWVFLS
jgi:hypothetical protein